jgi:hypothetical protein
MEMISYEEWSTSRPNEIYSTTYTTLEYPTPTRIYMFSESLKELCFNTSHRIEYEQKITTTFSIMNF